MNQEICKNIEDLYTSNIYPNCPNKQLCNNENSEILSKKPKMPYIGREYGNNTQIPNLLFLSLDSGLEHPNLHTIKELRTSVETENPRAPGPGNVNHWFQTFDIAEFILKDFFTDFNELIKHNPFYTDLFIAHTNSSKCTQNKSGKAQADNHLFKNCKPFVIQELGLFNAHIIITQGKKAEECLAVYEVVEKRIIETNHNGEQIKLSVFIKTIDSKKTLHIPMYHQSYYRGYWGQKKVLFDNIDQIQTIIQQLM